MSKSYHAIGTWVTANALAEVASPDTSNRLKRRVCERALEAPVYGQVVGVTYIYGWRYVPGGSDDQGYLTDRYAVLVYQVRLGLRAKPVFVAPASLAPLEDGHGRVLPWASPVVLYVERWLPGGLRELPRVEAVR